MRKILLIRLNGIGLAAVLAVTSVATAFGQSPAAHAPAASVPATNAVPVPADYVIGPDDALSVVFWRDNDMSAEVTVRPDGKISLPLLHEVQAAGLTPEQLRAKVTEAASKFVEEPNATVVVREIKSRRVFITGNVAKPASYSLVGEMNVLQLIAQAGGLLEYADSKKIVVMRTEAGKQHYFTVNYNDVVKQKNVTQNIALKPGDTVVVP